MKKLYRVGILLLIILTMSTNTFNNVQAQEDKQNEISLSDKKQIKNILEDLVEALEEKEYNDYLNLFHENSPIYLMHRSELRDAFHILSSYGLTYELENIRFVEKSGEEIKVEIDIITKSNNNNNEYIDRRNSFEYIFRSKDNQFKIYDMSVKNIEALDNKKVQSNIILGKKRLYYEDGSIAFEGLMKEGKPSGEGTRYYNDGKVMYEGTFKEGKISGEGIFYDEIGREVYEGEVEDGLPNGKGKAFYSNGRVFYDGYWKNGTFDRRGKIYYENGRTMYMGEFKEGRANGQGKGYFENGKLQYEGELKDDCSHGEGIEYYESGQIMYKGEFAKGIPHGKGTKYDKEGKIIHKGMWENGEPVQDAK